MELVSSGGLFDWRVFVSDMVALVSTEFTGQYLVDTPACKIPNADALDPTVRQFVRPPKPVKCDRGSPPLTFSDIDSVYLVPERLHLYGAG